MAKVLITSQVKDGAKWEASFRTHTDLFRSYGANSPVEFAVDGNSVIVCTDTDDPAAFIQTIGQQPTIDAMEADGVLRDTVKITTLDKQMSF